MLKEELQTLQLLLTMTLADYGLDGTNEGTSAQPYDLDLLLLQV